MSQILIPILFVLGAGAGLLTWLRAMPAVLAIVLPAVPVAGIGLSFVFC